MAKQVTCGVLIFNKEKELFLCHSTGNDFWDVPKGISDDGEDYIDTAIRELFEETGFSVVESELKDLGLFNLNKKKNIQLFIYTGSSLFKPENAVCTSYFEHYRTGEKLLEVDDFKYMNLDSALDNTSKSLSKVLKDIL